MNYPLKSSSSKGRRRNSRQRVALIIIILLIILFLFWATPLRGMLFSVSEPIWKVKNVFSNSHLLQYFKSKQALINDKLILEQKIFMTGNLLAENEILQKENELLKDLFGRRVSEQNRVLGTILVRPPQSFYDVLIIDIGADHNLKIGDKVVANGNVFIGEISEVMPKMAKVNLYSTPGHKLPVVLGESMVTAEAIGTGGGNFSIFLPREVEVEEGDVVVIPSITTNIFGIIEKVKFESKDSFQTVLFKSLVNISELSFVEVIKN